MKRVISVLIALGMIWLSGCGVSLPDISDEKYDAIIYPGFLGGIESALELARSKGIKLMTFNCDCQKPKYRLACLKADSIIQGQIAAKAAAELIGKNGQVGILLGGFPHAENVILL